MYIVEVCIGSVFRPDPEKLSVGPALRSLFRQKKYGPGRFLVRRGAARIIFRLLISSEKFRKNAIFLMFSTERTKTMIQ